MMIMFDNNLCSFDRERVFKAIQNNSTADFLVSDTGRQLVLDLLDHSRDFRQYLYEYLLLQFSLWASTKLTEVKQNPITDSMGTKQNVEPEEKVATMKNPVEISEEDEMPENFNSDNFEDNPLILLGMYDENKTHKKSYINEELMNRLISESEEYSYEDIYRMAYNKDPE